METGVYRLGEHPFAALLVPGDYIHPNAEGNELWARALFPMLRETEKLRSFSR